MSKKSLFIILCLVIFSLISLNSALRSLKTKSIQNILGSYTFAATKHNLFKLNRIRLTSSDGSEMNFYYEHGIWYFEEAADYYVKNEAIENFYNMVKNSILTEKTTSQPSDYEKINIKTFDESGTILDDVYLSGPDYAVMNYPGGDTLYKVTNTEDFSANPPDWLPSPLLKINPDLISAVNIDGKYANKNSLDETEDFSQNLKDFLSPLQQLDYEGIISNDLFDEQYASAQKKELMIYLVGGLDYRLNLYFDGENYYARISVEREPISKAEVNTIIELQNMYFDGWTFLLTNEQGEKLFAFDFEQ